MRKPRIKVCCIGSIEEAELAIEMGASAIGLVSTMPSGPGVIEEVLIAEIARFVPPPIATFLLTLDIAPKVDALLFDSGIRRLAVKELGGTGRIHDWAKSRRICETVGKPVFLAGGLRPENVGEAVSEVQPFGIDVCSGVRTNGRLDPVKLKTFLSAVHQGSSLV